MTQPYCSLNGQLIPLKEAALSISDIGIHRDYSVFDFFRTYNHIPVFLDAHIDRLIRSATLAGISLNLTRAELSDEVRRLTEFNKIPDSGIKILVTGGFSEDFSSPGLSANVLILQQPFTPWPAHIYTEGAGVLSHPYVRQNPTIKSTNYFEAMRQHRRMKEAQCVELLFYNEFISEASRSNVFMVKNKRIHTPANHILHGVTRNKILELFDVHWIDIPFNELFSYDEVFITSTVKEVLPIVRVDGKKVGNGKVGRVTAEVAGAFRDFLAPHH